MIFRRILTLASIPYALWLLLRYQYHFLDGVNLVIHEAGHILFMPLGQTLHILGGTILQLLTPIAFAIYFWRQQQKAEAGLCGIWLAESMMYSAVYIGDARFQRLPLIGGGEHDWHRLLSQWGCLEQCHQISSFVFILARILLLGSLGFALWQAFRTQHS